MAWRRSPSSVGPAAGAAGTTRRPARGRGVGAAPRSRSAGRPENRRGAVPTRRRRQARRNAGAEPGAGREVGLAAGTGSSDTSRSQLGKAGIISPSAERWQALVGHFRAASSASRRGSPGDPQGLALRPRYPEPEYNHRLFCVLTFGSRAQGPARRQLASARSVPYGAAFMCLIFRGVVRLATESVPMPTINHSCVTVA